MINNRQAGRRRGRGGQQRQGGGGNTGRVEQGNRIDNRARGNANQLLEKYKSLASDAQRQGDRVNTEYYLQFADHYFRVLADNRARFEENNPQARRQPGEGDQDGYDDELDVDGFDQPDRRPERMQYNGNSARDDRPQRDDGVQRDEGAQRMREDRPQREERRPAYEQQAGDGGERNEEQPRPRRGRPPRAPREETAGEGGGDDGRLSAAILPPAIQLGVEGEAASDDEMPAAPRRRGRPRRSEGPAEAAAE